MPVGDRRFVVGAASFDDLRTVLREGSGYAYQDAARIAALRQLLLLVLRIPAHSSVARARLATFAGAMDRAFKMLGQREAARPQKSPGLGRRTWPFNTVLGQRGARDRSWRDPE